MTLARTVAASRGPPFGGPDGLVDLADVRGGRARTARAAGGTRSCGRRRSARGRSVSSCSDARSCSSVTPGRCTRCNDRCPHRGVPLSLGSQQFPGTLDLRLPRLDLRPGDRRAAGGHHRRAGLADLRQGVRRDLPGGRAARPGVDLHRRRPRPAPPVEDAIPTELREHAFSWAGGSTSAAAGGATRPRTASTRDTPSTCIARRCGGCSR